MKNFNCAKSKIVTFCIIIGILLFAHRAYAQTIMGQTNVQVGATERYEIQGVSGVTWYFPTGVDYSSPGGTDYLVDATYNHVGDYSIYAYWSGGSANLQVTVTGELPAMPSINQSPAVSCGQAVLTRVGSPPSGITWYWQNSPTGKLTNFGSGSDKTVTSSGTYYLRARNDATYAWSESAGSVSVTVPTQPSVFTVDDDDASHCGDGTVTFSVEQPEVGTEYKWYDMSGSLLFTGVDFSPVDEDLNNGITTFEVEGVIGQCTTDRVTVTATVINLVVEVTDGQNSCNDNVMTLKAKTDYPVGITSGITHRWYINDDPNNGGYISGTPVSSASYVTQVTVNGQDKTYYVSAVYDGCETTRYPVSANYESPITPSINLVNQSSDILCGSGVYELRVESTNGGDFQWYDTPSGGTPLQSGGAYSPNISYANTNNGLKTFYVGGTLTDNLGCSHTISPRADITVQVKPLPNKPTVTLGPNCGPGVVTMTASGISGATYNWYNASGTYITSGTSHSTPSLSLSESLDYQVSAVVDGCEGPKEVVTVVVKEVPEDPVLEIQFQPTCSVATGSFVITNYNSEYTYTISPSAGVTRSGNTVTVPSGTYSVTATLGDCTSDASNYLTINAQPSTQTWYSDLEDGDGLGDPNITLVQCGQPEGYVSNSSDNCPLIDDPSNACEVHSSNPQDHNYIYSRTYQQESTTMIDPLRFVQNDILIQQITFFDGLGRPSQQVAIGQSPNANKDDIVTHMGYDGFGRQDQEWLPYTDSDPLADLGSFRLDSKSDTETYYETHYSDDIQSGSSNPFSHKKLEPSPLGRVLKQGAPGKDWEITATGDDHTIEFEYQSNATDEVRMFAVETQLANNTYSPTLVFLKDNLDADIEYYPAGSLFKSITYDENHPGTATKNHTTEEFKDKQGRVVLKRTYADMDTTDDGDTNDPEDAEIPHDTYYVYDDHGNLTYVLPPKMDAATETLANIITNMEELGYQYVYDHRNRLVEKQIPGKDREYIVYNKLDQPVLTQDAVQRPNREWLFTKYDALGRVVYTGIYTHDSVIGRSAMQTELEDHYGGATPPKMYEEKQGAVGDYHYYGNESFPDVNLEILTVNYYDGYNFNRASESSPPTSVFNATLTSNVKGLATGSKVKVLGTSDWITTVTRYDAKGRPIYTHSENAYLSTVDVMETNLDFVGKQVTIRSQHTRNGGTVVTVDNFEYDHVGRLLKQTQCVGDNTLGYSCQEVVPEMDAVLDDPTITFSKTATNSITVVPASPTESVTLSGTLTLKVDANAGSSGGELELIALNEYDKLGQLVRKNVGNTEAAPLQKVDYAYNIRGWLKSINQDTDNADGDLFKFGINYNTVAHGGAALFNGNIAETEWETTNDNVTRWYTYGYDALNRIVGATGGPTSNYDVSDIFYDKNGNIGKLKRQGPTGAMDDLTYGYYGTDMMSNRLQSVADMASGTEGFVDGATSTTEYGYDVNGNMTSDANKGITGISYNHLNLPTNIAIGSGNISYVYDATGTKLQKTVSGGGSVTDYAGNYVYQDGSLQFFSQPEGYVTPDGMNGYDYVYQYKDHLGNIRLSYVDDGNGGLEIVEENNYYPFGLKHKGYNDSGISPLGNDVAQKWKYQGQELVEDLGLDTFEFKYRMHDPAIGRFWQVDPLAEDYVYNGVYNFAENRVIDSAELEGLERIYAADGKFINQAGNSQEIRVLNNKAGDVQGLIGIVNNPDSSPEDVEVAQKTLNSVSHHGFETKDAAASSFAYSNNSESIKSDKEFGAAINTVTLSNEDGSKIEGTDNNTVAILGPKSEGTTKNVNVPDMIEAAENAGTPGTLSGFVHTHGNGSNDFSRGGGGLISTDESVSRGRNVPVYMSNKKGELKVLDANRGRDETIHSRVPRRN